MKKSSRSSENVIPFGPNDKVICKECHAEVWIENAGTETHPQLYLMRFGTIPWTECFHCTVATNAVTEGEE